MSQPVSQILSTKIFVVPPRRELVMREGLELRLDEMPRRRLTLISAPAGFGKTTLISSWVDSREFPAAWISLDAGDNDLSRFLSYLVASLRTLHPTVGEALLAALSTAPRPPIDALLGTLINDLAAIDRHFLLVLDDYHLIESKQVHDALLFILEHASPTLHIVLTTRADPPFALARLRVRGELLEIRAAALRFTAEEASRLFNGLARLGLSEAQLVALQERTEGWAAGLQMAVLSLQGRDDVEAFIAAFTGADRYVLDYLLEEVMAQLPEDLQRTMLDLSVLEQFNGSLCDALTGSSSGAELLAMLERKNLFLIPLDNHREWYRYHHLFADLLRHRLRQSRRDAIPDLHRRASRWYESQGMIMEALIQASLTGDQEGIVALLDRYWRDVIGGNSSGTLWEMIAVAPDDMVLRSPRLSLLKGWVFVIKGRFDDAVPFFDAVERILGERPAEGEGREIMGQAILLRAVICRDSGDLEGTIRFAERAMEFLPDHQPAGDEDVAWRPSRGMGLSVLGSAYSLAGDPLRAEQVMAEGVRYARVTGDPGNLIPALATLGRQYMHLGKLALAEETAVELMEFARMAPFPTPLLEMTPLQITARVQYERHQLEEARITVRKALEACGTHRVNPIAMLLRNLYQINDALRDWDAAEQTLDELGKLSFPRYEESLVVIAPMLRAHMMLHRGDIDGAMRWVDERFIDGEPDPLPPRNHYAIKTEELFYARILLHRGDVADAEHRLRLLQDEFERTGLLPPRIEAMVLRVAALQQRGDHDAASDLLAAALRLAAPDGFLRQFAYDAPMIARSLMTIQKRAAVLRLPPAFMRRVAEVCGVGVSGEEETAVAVNPGSAQAISIKDQDIMPLTNREAEILHLLGQGYSNQKIAERLYVSINTVKTHVSNVFEKLGASSRVDALLRARNAGLL